MEDLVRSYAATFALQGTIGVAAALMLGGLWLALRAPAARIWGQQWALLAAAQALAYWTVRETPSGVPSTSGAFAWVLASSMFAAVSMLQFVGARVLRTAPAEPADVPKLTFGVVVASITSAAVAALSIAWATRHDGNFIELTAVFLRPLSFLAILMAMRELMQAPTWNESPGLKVLAVAFAAVGVRAILALIIAWLPASISRAPATNVALVTLQVLVQVMFAIASTAAVLESERLQRFHEEERLSELERVVLNQQRVESIGRLASGIAHDFNNLLAAIRQGVELAKETPDDAREREEILTDVLIAADRGAELTRHLLDYAKGGSTEPELVDVVERVRKLSGMLRRAVPASLEWDVNLPPSEVPVRIVPAQFDQVLLNLVVNARNAQPKGGRIGVRVGVESSPAPHVEGQRPAAAASSYAVLEVSDRGPGVSPDVAARVLEPFYTTRGESGGTGLGLSTCVAIAQANGGALEFTSRVGEGTRVRLILPILTGSAAA